MRLLLYFPSVIDRWFGEAGSLHSSPFGEVGWGFIFALSVKNISKNAWIIVWKIVTLHAFSEFKHIKIVE